MSRRAQLNADRAFRMIVAMERRVARREALENAAIAAGRAGYGERQIAAQARVARDRLWRRIYREPY